MSDQTDEQLMQAFREGNARAFELLLSRHERKVWHFLRRSVGDPTTAEDLLQEVFLRVIKAQADSVDFKGEAKFTTWVYAIARNLCVDHARRAVHRDARSLDAPTRPDDEAGEIVRRLQDEAIIWSGMPVVGTAASRLPAMVKLLVEAASFIERLTRSIAMKNELIDASNEAARLPPQKGST